jgi:hypothetical protein
MEDYNKELEKMYYNKPVITKLNPDAGQEY